MDGAMERERFQIEPSGFWGELSLITGVIIAAIMPLAQGHNSAPMKSAHLSVPEHGRSLPRLFYFSPEQNSMIAVSVEKRGQELSLGNPHALFPVPNVTVLGSMSDVHPRWPALSDFRCVFLGPQRATHLGDDWDAELKKNLRHCRHRSSICA